MSRSRPPGGYRSWGAVGRGFSEYRRAGVDHSGFLSADDGSIGGIYEHEVFKRQLAEPTASSMAEYDRRKAEIRAEVDGWFAVYRQAEHELPPDWEILWKMGVPDGQPFRAHLVDPERRRETFHGTGHVEVFTRMLARIRIVSR